MIPPYWVFPGDNQLLYEALWRTHAGWLASAEYAGAAAKASGIEVETSTLERWFRFGGYAYLLDQLIDEQPPHRRDEAYEVYQRLVSGEYLSGQDMPAWVNPDLHHTAALFYNAMGSVRPETRDMAMEFLACAKSKAATRKIWQYALGVTREGRLMGRLMTECMTDQERRSKHFQRFRSWFANFAAGGALFDAARDLGRDYAAARTSVRPTRLNRLVLIAWCLWTSASLLLRPRIFKGTFRVFPRFWGVPFRLRESDGMPAAAWRAKSREAEVATAEC